MSACCFTLHCPVQGCPAGTLQTNEAQQPSYELHSNFLPALAFRELQAELLHRRPIMLDSHSQQGLNAVNINFNLAGAPALPCCPPASSTD